jgi:hypothetical protein
MNEAFRSELTFVNAYSYVAMFTISIENNAVHPFKESGTTVKEMQVESEHNPFTSETVWQTVYVPGAKPNKGL